MPKLSLNTPLNTIGLPVRVSSSLFARTTLRTVGDLIAKTEKELRDEHNGIGPLSIARIKEVLAKHGLGLRVEKGLVLGLDHFPGCSPPRPCVSCRVMYEVRRKFERRVKKIPGLGFVEFIRKLEEHAGRDASKPEQVEAVLVITGPLAGAMKDILGIYVDEKELIKAKVVE